MEREGAGLVATPRASGAVAGEAAPDEGLDAFGSLADAYLLPVGDLGADLTDVTDAALGDSGARLAGEGEGGRADAGGRDGDALLGFGFDAGLRSEPEPWTPHGAKAGRGVMDSLGGGDKAEPGDSSEWEQTRDQQLGGSNPLMHQHTDSPESLMMISRPGGGAERPQQMDASMHGLEEAAAAFAQDDFMYRSPMGLGSCAPDALPASRALPARYSMQQAMELEGFDPLATPAAWDRRPAFASPLEHDIRAMGRGERLYWPGPADLPGQPRQWGPVRREPAVFRMRSDVSGLLGQQQQAERPPPRRQYSADLHYALPPMLDAQGGGSGPLTPDAYMSPSVDGYGRKPYLSPRLARQPSYAAAPSASGMLESGSPADGSRKRTREAYSLTKERPMAAGERQLASQSSGSGGRGVRGPSSTGEERLIAALKSQILCLDTHTKASLKESLYRISRNTNARVSGMVEVPPGRLSQRHGYMDRLVANLMYNRFEAPPLQQQQAMPPPLQQQQQAWAPPASYGSGGYPTPGTPRVPRRASEDAGLGQQQLRQESGHSV